jgi:hypothetical protein
MLPPKLHECIHMMFTLMWATGITPQLEGKPHLLYKKQGRAHGHHKVQASRPPNTIYKLYTRTVTMALYDYAEKHSVLSSTQKGFRKYASTMSVQTLIMALEDATRLRTSTCAQVDFSNAFNMIDHDKLLAVMWDLGFPTDAIDVV